MNMNSGWQSPGLLGVTGWPALVRQPGWMMREALYGGVNLFVSMAAITLVFCSCGLPSEKVVTEQNSGEVCPVPGAPENRIDLDACVDLLPVFDSVVTAEIVTKSTGAISTYSEHFIKAKELSEFFDDFSAASDFSYAEIRSDWWYSNRKDDGEFDVVAQSSESCLSNCEDSFATMQSKSGFTNYCGLVGCSYSYIAVLSENGPFPVSNIVELGGFLGEIDTYAKANYWQHAHGYEFAKLVTRVADEIEVVTFDNVSSCPVTVHQVLLSIAKNGKINEKIRELVVSSSECRD